jgi:hypothetical protein
MQPSGYLNVTNLLLAVLLHASACLSSGCTYDIPKPSAAKPSKDTTLEWMVKLYYEENCGPAPPSMLLDEYDYYGIVNADGEPYDTCLVPRPGMPFVPLESLVFYTSTSAATSDWIIIAFPDNYCGGYKSVPLDLNKDCKKLFE